MSQTSVATLKTLATELRIDSIRSTTEAGSGHPTTCMSAAEIVSALFFAEMRYDPKNPQNPDNDRFVLSKGHAAPILYAAWAEAGIISREALLTLRRIDSDLEGHPTPRLPWVDVATGSLGQGLCAGVGAFGARMTPPLARVGRWPATIAGIAAGAFVVGLQMALGALATPDLPPVSAAPRTCR